MSRGEKVTGTEFWKSPTLKVWIEVEESQRNYRGTRNEEENPSKSIDLEAKLRKVMEMM